MKTDKAEIKAALEVLKNHGVKIPKKELQKYTKLPYEVSASDVRKFKGWVSWAERTKQRFVVGIGGRNGRSLTFHSSKGLEGRRRHITDLQGQRRKKNGVEVLVQSPVGKV